MSLRNLLQCIIYRYFNRRLHRANVRNESYILPAETTKTTKRINKSLCRLINPPKSDIGKIRKTILDKIITKIVSLTNVNQWKNSNSNVEWYKAITTKDQHRFAIFDTESFYPSVSLHLFNDALYFAKP